MFAKKEIICSLVSKNSTNFLILIYIFIKITKIAELIATR